MTVLTAPVSLADTTLLVDTVPSAKHRLLQVDSEFVIVLARGSNYLEVERAALGSAPASHATNAELTPVVVAVQTSAPSAPPPAEVGTGGGSPTTIYKRTVTLSAAQIRALPSVPAEIIPATEVLDYAGAPSTWFVPIAAQVVVARDADFTAVALEGGPPAGTVFAYLVWGADWSMSAATVTRQGVQENATGIFGGNAQVGGRYLANFSLMDWNGGANALNGSLLDNGLYLTVAGNGGMLDDFVDGDNAATATVTVLYVVLDL